MAEADAAVADDYVAALDVALATLARSSPALMERVEAAGHRIVHGGESLVAPVIVDAAVEAQIEEFAPLAPLHNPAGLAVLRGLRLRLPALAQVAVFDTAFHASMPVAARSYALPQHLVAKHGLHRYGFHGINHANVLRRCATALDIAAVSLRIVSCHLGAGGSVTAIAQGRSVDTSMGMTPLEGLVMATRPGDVDPGVIVRLMREADLGADALDDILNRHSGLLALAGTIDMAQVQQRASAGDARSAFAIDVYVHRLCRYIGAMTAVMGGADAIVFSGGIGENSALIRERACARLGYLGGRLDPVRNGTVAVTHASPVAIISATSSALSLLVVAADEERAIAEDVGALLQARR